MKIPFVKMHGIGNDYIYVNCLQQTLENPEQLAIAWSNRHTGIGADGLVLILPSESCDFRMRMFNADGSEAEMCGNAARCIGKYVYDCGLTSKKLVTLETKAGVKPLTLVVNSDDCVDLVTVDMGEPLLDAALIPVDLPLQQVVDEQIFVDGESYNITCVSMGNPHAVIFTSNIDELDLPKQGAAIETNELFPNRTNVEFVEKLSDTHLRMRVWERGSGETLACGTGACAVLVAAVLNELSERTATISLLGGDLEIGWDEVSNHVFLTGPATFVFEGEIDIN